MKFGKQIKRLADPAHLNHCVAYDILKKAINVVVASELGAQVQAPDLAADIQSVNEAFLTPLDFSRTSCRPLDSRFHGLLQHELSKVNRFFALQMRNLVDSLREVHQLIARAGVLADMTSVERQLDGIAEDLVKAGHFRRLNFTAFKKIAKKFDKSMAFSDTGAGTLCSWFLPQVYREFFVTAPLEPLILALAWGYSALRRHRRSTDGDASASLLRSPSSKAFVGSGASGGSVVMRDAVASGLAAGEEGTTNTFWLMPSARIRTLCTLVKRFELVLPPSEGLGGAPLTPEGQLRLVMAMSIERLSLMPRLTAETSLVYYDTPSFELYSRCLEAGTPSTAGTAARGGSSGTFRCRRTQALGGHGGGDLVERDSSCAALGAHAFTPVENLQAPDAFPMVSDGTSDGSIPAADLRAAAAAAQASASPRAAAFAAEVAEAARDPTFRPMAFVGSSRVLLRGDSPSTEGITVALDKDVQFSNGPAGPAVTASSEVVDFPYFLLEVPAFCLEGQASWLDEVRGRAALRNVGNFSLGAHAIASLHRATVPRLPEWFDHLADVQASAPDEAWGLSLEFRTAVGESEGGKAVPKEHSTGTVSDQGGVPGAPALVPLRIEPKGFLASERTMLEWMHTVFALAMLGIGLWQATLKGDDGLLRQGADSIYYLRICSLAFVCNAVVFAWVSVFTHIRRCKALLEPAQKERAFNNRLAPTVFALGVAASLMVHMVVQTAPMFLVVGRDDGIGA